MEIRSEPPTNKNHGCFPRVMFSSPASAEVAPLGNRTCRASEWVLNPLVRLYQQTFGRLSACKHGSRELKQTIFSVFHQVPALTPKVLVKKKVAAARLQKPRVRFANARRVENYLLPCFFHFVFFLLDHILLAGTAANCAPPRPHRGLGGLWLLFPSLPQTEGRGSDKARPRRETHRLGSSLP